MENFINLKTLQNFDENDFYSKRIKKTGKLVKNGGKLEIFLAKNVFYSKEKGKLMEKSWKNGEKLQIFSEKYFLQQKGGKFIMNSINWMKINGKFYKFGENNFENKTVFYRKKVLYSKKRENVW